jgi:glycosyltransferase involved in cell wall biosynthesis
VAALGCEIEILAPSWRGLKSHTIDGMKVHRFRYGPSSWETLTGEEGAPSRIRRNPFLVFLACLYLWGGFWALMGLLLKRKKYDVVEVHWPFPHAWMALPALWAGIPLIYHYHSAENKLAVGNALYKRVFKWSLGWARWHIANSSYTAGLVKRQRPNIDVKIIPYGSPLKFEKAPAVSETRRRRKLLFVGRHIERKGIPYLIDAMKLLPADYSLTIVGDGDLTPALKKESEGNPRITFTGRLSSKDIVAAYVSHDIFVAPSIVDSKGDTEGLGVVLIEAAAAGLPIVASNVGGIPDVVLDGKTGLLVGEKSAQELARAIMRLGEDEKLCQELIHAAQQRAQEKFSWEYVAKQTLEIYQAKP